MVTRAFRIFFALLGLSALVTEIVVLLSEGTFDPGNFFSFFTVLSNIAAVSVLAYFGLKKNPSKAAESFRAAATLYMVMTGVIFAILLSGITEVRLTATPWDNIVLHYIMPIVVAVDWLLRPSKAVVFSVKNMLVWLSVPVLYVAYSLVRGLVVDWYPYPFLNPRTSSYLTVLVVVCVLAVGVVLTAVAMKAYAKHRAK